jgi:3-phenylpropionate/trans-cinnamate dioxygenase ferredoxin reductase component
VVSYPYLIIGAGMTANAAARGIREIDLDTPIGMIGEEPDPPYNRPPLSKGLWKGVPLENIWRAPPIPGVTLHLGRRIQSLDLSRKVAIDDQESVYTFDKCLLATGSAPRRLPFGGDRVVYLRTLADYCRLRRLTTGGQRFAVIGGGFIGAEIAAALAMNGKDVTMVFPRTGIAERILPRNLVDFVSAYFRQKRVEVLTETEAYGLEARGAELTLMTRGVRTGHEREFCVDGVIAGIGIRPNVELAETAGLSVDDGILVDEHLRTTHPDVYAAGDVARIYSPALDSRIRVEHEDNANAMGHHAGRAMAGRAEPYDYLSYFYSEMFDITYQAVGDIDAGLDTVEDWENPYVKGTVYYLRDGRVRGVLTWNRYGQVGAARRLIAEPGPFGPTELKGRLLTSM